VATVGIHAFAKALKASNWQHF